MIVGQHSLALWLDTLRGLTTHASHSHCAHRWCDVVYGMLQVMSSNSLQAPVGETIDQYNSCSSTHYVMHHKKSTGGDGTLTNSWMECFVALIDMTCCNKWKTIAAICCLQPSGPLHVSNRYRMHVGLCYGTPFVKLHGRYTSINLPQPSNDLMTHRRLYSISFIANSRYRDFHVDDTRGTTPPAKRRWKQRLVRDFEQAWDARDFRSMHQSARSLSGRHLGPKRRRYDKPLSCAPSKHQWSEYMQQHGPQGGCSAQVVTWN